MGTTEVTKFGRNGNYYTNQIKNSGHPDGETWKTNFQELYSPTEIQNSNQNETINKLDNLERSIKGNQNPLDFPITMRELEDKLRVLEPKKACGVDSILNEMLKHTDQRFKLAMLKLFNDVLCVGFFPEIWNKGLISPIHKSGDKLDPTTTEASV